MRVAAISDIHGNVPALQAVIDQLGQVRPDVVVCCGDIAAGPMPRQAINELRRLDAALLAVRGNADREAVAVFDGEGSDDLPHDSLWAGQRITGSQRDWLSTLPMTATLESDRLGTMVFCHGTPRDDAEIVVETTPEHDLLASLDGVAADVVVCGNTHMQFDRRVGPYRVVNPGSVGMPYGGTGAYWALLDTDVEMCRTDYDLVAAAETIRQESDWPLADMFAERNVRSVPSRTEALEAFASARAGKETP